MRPCSPSSSAAISRSLPFPFKIRRTARAPDYGPPSCLEAINGMGKNSRKATYSDGTGANAVKSYVREPARTKPKYVLIWRCVVRICAQLGHG